jgi:hypothetical protein
MEARNAIVADGQNMTPRRSDARSDLDRDTQRRQEMLVEEGTGTTMEQ